MRQLSIVRLDIECDEPSHGLDAIECNESLVLEGTLPGLDQGVREADIPKRQRTAQYPGDDEFGRP